MLRHLVMFRRRPDVAPDADLERRLAARLEGLNQHVPGTRYWLFRANELSRPVSWDYILDSSFDDLQAMQDYLLHPIHQALILDLKTYFEWAVVDYTEDPSLGAAS